VAIPLLLLNPYVDAILVIALGICIGGIMNSLTPFIAKIPWVGGSIANAVSGMAKAITHACGEILSPISHAVGGTLHAVSRLVDWSYSEFRRHAHLLLQLAETVAGLAFAFAALRSLVHRIEHAGAGVSGRIKTLEREWHGIEHRVKTLEQKIAQGIGHDLRIRIKALEKEYTGLRDSVIPGLRSGIKAAENEVTQLQQFIKALPGTRYLDWAAGIVTAALGIEILNLLRCPRAKSISNQRGCSMWGAMDDLLGLLALGIVAADFEELIHEAQDLTEFAVGAFDEVFGLSR